LRQTVSRFSSLSHCQGFGYLEKIHKVIRHKSLIKFKEKLIHEFESALEEGEKILFVK